MKLYVPKENELGFRQALLSDPAAMSYNRGYELSFDGYHPDTGCIDFPPEDWRSWHETWVRNARENGRFYAYIEQGGAFIGDVCLHSADCGKSYELGILIAPAYRGRGLSGQALRLLAEYAFSVLGAEELRNRFESARAAAVRLHSALGFTVTDEGGGMFGFSLRREDFTCE